MKKRAASLAGLLGLVLMAPGELPAQEDATTIVAAAVRERGYICTDPQTPSVDFEYSTPGEKAWLIQCDEGTYRVKFMGDTGPQVEQVFGG